MLSCGGGPGSMAAKGPSVAERRGASKAGGVVGLIFIATVIARESQSLLSASESQFAPRVINMSVIPIPPIVRLSCAPSCR